MRDYVRRSYSCKTPLPVSSGMKECGRHEPDPSAGGNEDRDGVARAIVGKERGGDERRGAAGYHRGELIAQRGTGV